MKRDFYFFVLFFGFASIFVLQENSLAAPSFHNYQNNLETDHLVLASIAPLQLTSQIQHWPNDRLNNWNKSSASIEQWRTRLRVVTSSLLPGYRLSSGPLCSSAVEDSYQKELYFYSLTQEPSNFSIEIIPSETVSAIALDQSSSDSEINTVILTTELLSHINSGSELAFIVAHELAHLELGHNTSTLPHAMFTDSQLRKIQSTHQNWELNADLAALKSLNRAGYETASVYDLLTRLAVYEKRSAPELLHSHPTMTARIEALARSAYHDADSRNTALLDLRRNPENLSNQMIP